MSEISDSEKLEIFTRLVIEMRSNERFSQRCASIMMIEEHEVDAISYFMEEFISNNEQSVF